LWGMSKRKELLFYSIFLLLIAVNFFISDPSTFGWGNDDAVLNSYWYRLVNTPLVIVANIFYVLFLLEFYLAITQHRLLLKILRTEVWGLAVALIIFFIMLAFGITSNLLFNILNFIGLLIGIWLLYIIIKAKLPYTRIMAMGFAANLLGTMLSVCMLILLSQGVKHLLVYDYPFVFVKLGVLTEIFFFNIAIFKKWHSQEKLLALQGLENELAIEKLRNRISGQLHDDIGSTLSGVSIYSQMANDLLDKGKHEDAKKSLGVIQNSADEMVEKLGDLIWSVNPKQDSLEMLFERLEQYAIQMCSAKNIRFNITVPQNFKHINLPAEYRYNIYLFCKEAINNAAKYSLAGLLEMTVKQYDNLLKIAVYDNGKGFDAAAVKRGNGLNNMQKRAEEMGAAFNLQSTVDKSTVITLTVKSPNEVLPQ
jgi:signal transduction histidine kinase